MKKIFFFAFLLLAPVLLQAQSIIQIIGENNRQIFATVEGYDVYLDESGTNIVVCNLASDTYTVSLFPDKTAERPLRTIRVFVEVNERAILTINAQNEILVKFEVINPDDVTDASSLPPAQNVISDENFQALLKNIEAESFDKNRLQVITVSSKDVYFTTEQVKAMIETFSFDGKEKMETAKLLYNQTVDNQNYYKLKESFSFMSNKDELMKFLEEQP